MSAKTTISEAINTYLRNVTLARSRNTARTYRNALEKFSSVLEDNGISPTTNSVKTMPEDAIAWFAMDLKDYASATERLYLTAATQLFEFIHAEELASPNLQRVRMLISQRARRPGVRLPQFPRNDIDTVLQYLDTLPDLRVDDEKERLRNLRDRAFLITLADTGLRVHEACNLRRGDLDRHEGRAIIIGKGNQEAVIRFSRRSLQALDAYLHARQALDGASGRPLGSLPLFARHDPGAGKKVKRITTRTGGNIVTQRVTEALGPEAGGTITPHSFRHYFVTTILRATQGNLKLAQELARHKNIAVTQRYAHLSDDELDRGYHEVFEK